MGRLLLGRPGQYCPARRRDVWAIAAPAHRRHGSPAERARRLDGPDRGPRWTATRPGRLVHGSGSGGARTFRHRQWWPLGDPVGWSTGGPGVLERDRAPDPLTPLYADFGPGNLSDDADLEELATPVPTKRRIVVDGYMYTGVLTHPAPPTAVHIAAFEQRLGQRHELELCAAGLRKFGRRWSTDTQPCVPPGRRRW